MHDNDPDDDEIHYPTGFGLSDIVSWGSFGLICLDATSQTIVKSAHDVKTQPHLDAERRIYERFTQRGSHPSLLTYLGPYDDGSAIRLQYAPQQDLRTFRLRRGADMVTADQRRQWAIQIADALSFVHRVGVVHGDLTCANVFLDEQLHAKVADFSGSSLDGSLLLVEVTTSHAHPVLTGSVQGDVFALGSLCYELETGFPPYRTLSDREIEERFSREEFPDVDLIRKCWEGGYDDCSMVVQDLKGD
nr:megakaryocyte-associated tyrosine-protein kinase [Quercus suber]